MVFCAVIVISRTGLKLLVPFCTVFQPDAVAASGCLGSDGWLGAMRVAVVLGGVFGAG